MSDADRSVPRPSGQGRHGLSLQHGAMLTRRPTAGRAGRAAARTVEVPHSAPNDRATGTGKTRPQVGVLVDARVLPIVWTRGRGIPPGSIGGSRGRADAWGSRAHQRLGWTVRALAQAGPQGHRKTEHSCRCSAAARSFASQRSVVSTRSARGEPARGAAPDHPVIDRRGTGPAQPALAPRRRGPTVRWARRKSFRARRDSMAGRSPSMRRCLT